jgi:hypothetical protein
MKQFKRKGLFFCVVAALAMLSCMKSYAQNYSVSTNAAQWLMLGTANIQAGYPAARHISIEGGFAYNPFTFGKKPDRKYFRRTEVYAGGRYWPWFVNSGWFMSAYADWAKFAYAGIFTKKAYEGYAYGLKIGGGYALMLDKGINLEMGLGAFAGEARYTEYSCATCGKDLGKKEKFIIAPASILLGLTIVF